MEYLLENSFQNLDANVWNLFNVNALQKLIVVVVEVLQPVGNQDSKHIVTSDF